MINAPEPRELAARSFTVTNGEGSLVWNLSGYLDALIIDVPGNETYRVFVKGPTGIEYHLTPADEVLTGDTTYLFDKPLPMTGKMTLGITESTGDGTVSFRPVGNLKGT